MKFYRKKNVQKIIPNVPYTLTFNRYNKTKNIPCYFKRKYELISKWKRKEFKFDVKVCNRNPYFYRALQIWMGTWIILFI